MIKPDSLRAALVAAIPELARDPDKLSIFVESGNVVARASPPTAFEYRYRLTLLMMDMTTHTDAVMLPLLLWVARHQPEIFANWKLGEEALKFEANFVDQTKVDLSIEIDLTEAVSAVARPDGGYDLTHWEEPDYGALFEGPLPGAPHKPPLAQLFVAGEPQAVVPLPTPPLP